MMTVRQQFETWAAAHGLPLDGDLPARLLAASHWVAYQQGRDDVSSGFRVNTTSGVAVSEGYCWAPIDEHTPRGVKLQLLGKGGVANYGVWDGKEPFYTHWAPVPRRCTATHGDNT